MSSPLTSMPVLSSERVRLRPFCSDDAEMVGVACRDAPDIAKNTFMASDMGDQQAAAWVAHSVESWTRDTPRFAITEVSSDMALGQVGVALNWNDRRAEVFYWLAKDARGRGLATDAVNLVTDWVFSNFDIHRVQLVTEPSNHASEAVAQRCGFTNEGLLRAWQHVKGKQPDVHMWSRLRKDAK